MAPTLVDRRTDDAQCLRVTADELGSGDPGSCDLATHADLSVVTALSIVDPARGQDPCQPTSTWRDRTLLVLGVLGAAVTFVSYSLPFLPGSSIVTLPATMLVPTIGPLVVLGSVTSLLLLIWCRTRVAPGVALCSAVVAVVATVFGVVVLASMVRAIDRVGGSVDVVSALFRSPGMSGDPDRSVTFATVDGVDLHASIYLPVDVGPEQRAPVAVFVHGGGWISGGPDDFSTKLRWFSEQGWLVVGVEYRLSIATLHTWGTSTADVGCALTWAASHAALRR